MRGRRPTSRSSPTVNPAHRLAGATAVERAVNVLAERHATAEDRLTEQLDSAHAELTRERDVLFAVLTGLDVPVGVVDDSGRILLVNPAARRMLVSRSRIAAGRSIFGVFDAEDLTPLLTRALAGERPSAVVAGTPIRLARITGPDEPGMVLIIGEPGEEPAGPVVGLSVDLARPSRPAVTREEWLATPLDQIVFTVLDCETTGLHSEAGDRLIALGAVRVDGADVRADDTFDALVNPGRHIPESSTKFHGISDELVADAPTGAVVLTDFADYAADSVLVGHHLAFDLGFLGAPGRRGGDHPRAAEPGHDDALGGAGSRPGRPPRARRGLRPVRRGGHRPAHRPRGRPGHRRGAGPDDPAAARARDPHPRRCAARVSRAPSWPAGSRRSARSPARPSAARTSAQGGADLLGVVAGVGHVGVQPVGQRVGPGLGVDPGRARSSGVIRSSSSALESRTARNTASDRATGRS